MEDNKTFSLPSGTHLTQDAVETLHDIAENISPIDLRNTLMELYQTYVLQRCHDLPLTFEELASHVYSLDCLLKILVDTYVAGNRDHPGTEAPESEARSQNSVASSADVYHNYQQPGR